MSFSTGGGLDKPLLQEPGEEEVLMHVVGAACHFEQSSGLIVKRWNVSCECVTRCKNVNNSKWKRQSKTCFLLPRAIIHTVVNKSEPKLRFLIYRENLLIHFLLLSTHTHSQRSVFTGWPLATVMRSSLHWKIIISPPLWFLPPLASGCMCLC